MQWSSHDRADDDGSGDPPGPGDSYEVTHSVKGLKEALVVKSDFFEARVVAEVGDNRAWLESIFQRGKDNKLVMLRRLNSGAE